MVYVRMRVKGAMKGSNRWGGERPLGSPSLYSGQARVRVGAVSVEVRPLIIVGVCPLKASIGKGSGRVAGATASAA